MSNTTASMVNAAVIGILVHSGYVVYRTLAIEDALGLNFWETLRIAASSELPLLPIFLAVSFVLAWPWERGR